MARTVYYFDRGFMWITGGRSTLSGFGSGLPIVVLTTIGARTGIPRSQPLLCIRGEGNAGSFAFVASNWGQHRNPAWYVNLKANPSARCSIDGRAVECVAREASGAEYEAYWNQAVKAHAGFSAYRQRAGRRIPIMVMTPVKGPDLS